jgi:hypothetical protein
VESQIEAFVDKYSALIEAQSRDARRRIRSLFPRGLGPVLSGQVLGSSGVKSRA